MIQKLIIFSLLFFSIIGTGLAASPEDIAAKEKIATSALKHASAARQSANEANTAAENSTEGKALSSAKSNKKSAQDMVSNAEKTLADLQPKSEGGSIKTVEIQVAENILNNAKGNLKEAEAAAVLAQETFDKSPTAVAAKKSDKTASEAEKTASSARTDACDLSGQCIDKASFIINTGDFMPGFNFKKGTTEQTVNNLLGTIIQKLMIALGSIALLIMTIGSGYMILYHGQDELLSKGKSIFMSGVIALVVALSSYYLVSFLRFVLYSA